MVKDNYNDNFVIMDYKFEQIFKNINVKIKSLE